MVLSRSSLPKAIAAVGWLLQYNTAAAFVPMKLPALQQKTIRLYQDLSMSAFDGFSKYAEKQQPAEYFLQGKIGWISGPEPEIELAIQRYNHDAVSVDRPGGIWPRDRTNDIRIIYGPSGSGKTLYALKGLAQVRNDNSDWKPLVLYANLSAMRQKLGEDAEAAAMSANPGVTVDEKAAEMLASEVITVDVAMNWLEETMTSSITELLREDNLAFDSKKKLDMTISVVLDGAMNAVFLIQNKSNLSGLFSVIYEFCTLPRLIVTGVGVEEYTKDLSSGVGFGKWRMWQWGRKNFDACVKADKSFNNYHAKAIVEMIEMHPFLEQLMTNARTAYFLADTLKFFAAEGVQWPPEFVAVVAQHVAAKYIANSGLCSIDSDKQRMKVVQAVLRLLWASSASRNIPIWPLGMLKNQFASNKRFVSEDFNSKEVVLIFSLLDINVEYQCGELTRVNKKRYPIEISPALTIVLYQLLDVLETKIASRWFDFEVLAALNELSLMVIFSESVDKPFQLRFLRNPVPALQSQIYYDVPKVGGQCVYVNEENEDNEEKVPYADVLAPGRFIQCKYTAIPSNGYRLDIIDELRKMGLLRNDKSIAKACTLALCDQWDKNTEGEEIDKVIEEEHSSRVVSTRAFRQAYPVRVLLQRNEGFYSDYVRFQLKDNKNISQAKNNEENSEKLHYNADDEFQHNITAIFYTNAYFFMLVDGKDGKDGKHTITTTDVDREGVLVSDHSFHDKQIELVSPKVALRFIFVCGEEVPPKDTEDW